MKELLKDILANNILLELVDGELNVLANVSYPDPALIARIKENKGRLIEFLTNNNQEGFNASLKSLIPVVPQQAAYPLSSAQRRLWILSQFHESNIAYNIPAIYWFEGKLEYQALEDCFSRIIERQ